MAILKQRGSVYSSAPDYYFFSNANDSDDILDLTYAVASNGTFDDFQLLHALYNESGSPIGSQSSLGHYNIPPKNTKYNTSFDLQYGGFALSKSLHGVFFTVPAFANTVANSAESIKFQEYNNSGAKVGALKTLRFSGATTIKYLTNFNSTSGAEFGKAVTVAYSTYNPVTQQAQIAYERFGLSGNPLSGGVLRSFQDGENHQFRFGTYYTALNPNNGGVPSYYLLNVGPAGTHEMQVEIFSTNMTTVLQTATFMDKGPGGQASTSLDSFTALRPGTGTQDNYTVFSQTFEYKDTSGKTHYEIELEQTNASTLATLGANEFGVDDDTGVAMQHLDNGNFLVLYKLDSGQSYVREFNASLKQVGTAYAIPKDNYGFNNFVALGNDKFEIFWLQDITSGANAGKQIQHHAFFDAGATIAAAASHHA